MPINDSSLAAGVGAGVQNVQFRATAQVMTRKILVMGSPLASKIAGLSLAVPQTILNPADAINRYGAGSMLARLIAQAFAGCNGQVQIDAFPEADGSNAATGTFTIAGSPTAAGTLAIYIAGTLYSVPVAATDTPTTIATALVALITADANCPTSAANASGVVTLTSRSKGVWGNFISMAVNAYPQNGDALPAGVTCAIVAMSAGAGVPTVGTDIANGLGTGSNQNQNWYTDVVHGYCQDATTLAAISTYNGTANGFTGNYDRLVGRPFRVFLGDAVTGSGGLTALQTLAGNNLNDRTHMIVAAPGSLTHPAEIAAIACGLCARVNSTRAEQNYVGVILPGVDVGNASFLSGNRWTDQYTNRDIAVKAGISPTMFSGGALVLQNVVTLYNPATTPQTSNVYREARNISIIQNILYAKKANYSGPKWQGFTIVSDTKNVTGSSSRLNARDIQSVIDDELALAKSFAANAWIYDPNFTIAQLKTAVSVRVGGDGFVINTPYILSGVGNIIDANALLDISLAVLNG